MKSELFKKMVALTNKRKELEERWENDKDEKKRLELEITIIDKKLTQLVDLQNTLRIFDDLAFAFTRLEGAFENIDEEVIHNYIKRAYPFDKDFFTLSSEVVEWVEVTKRKIRDLDEE